MYWLQPVRKASVRVFVCLCFFLNGQVYVWFYGDELSECVLQTAPQCLCSADSLQENIGERVLLDIYTQQPYRLAMMMAPSWPQKTAINPEKARARQSEKQSGIYGVQSKKSKHGSSYEGFEKRKEKKKRVEEEKNGCSAKVKPIQVVEQSFESLGLIVLT